MQSPPSSQYDLVILGAGPAGEKAAAQAGYFGKRVAIVERAPEPGGAGVHTGTLPSKTLRESAVYLSGYRNRELYGIAVQLEPGATLPVLMARKAAIARTESERIRENLKRHHVDYVTGHGRIPGPNTVTVATANGVSSLAESFCSLPPARAPFGRAASPSTIRAFTTATRSSASSGSRLPSRSSEPASSDANTPACSRRSERR